MNTVSQKVVERSHVRVPDSGFAAHVNISKRWQYNGAAPFKDIVACVANILAVKLLGVISMKLSILRMNENTLYSC